MHLKLFTKCRPICLIFKCIDMMQIKCGTQSWQTLFPLLHMYGHTSHSEVHSCILTHWGRLTHICVSKLTIIGSDNGLSPDRRQAIVWTNAGILLIRPQGTNFSEILSELHTFSSKKTHSKMSSVKWRPFCFGLNVLITPCQSIENESVKPQCFQERVIESTIKNFCG